MSAAEDQADVDEVLHGNILAFELLVRRWEGPLLNLAYRFFRDRGRAEEMTQEAFLRAYRSLKLWRRESVFSSWLFALATNLFRSELRRGPLATVSFDDAFPPSDRGSAARAFEEADQARAVRRAVDALPAKYREVLILFYFHDKDVAATHSVGVPEGTIKARLSRGRELLGSKLSHLGTNAAAASAERRPV